MPTITGSARNGEAFVKVEVALSVSRTRGLLARAQQPPPPQALPGLLDPCAALTLIDPSVRQSLYLPPFRRLPILTPHSGPSPPPFSLYKVRLTIVHPSGDARLNLVIDRLTVAAATIAHLQTRVLIGWDVLERCQLLYDGPAQQFSLSY